MKLFRQCHHHFNIFCSRLPEDVIALLCRVAIASAFWRSVQTKITGWEVLGQSLQFYNISASTFLLFEYEYGLPLLSPGIAAHAATAAEFFLPILLVLGFATRISALLLLVMTAVIQCLVLPAGWPTHILWLVPLLYLLKHGAGTLSVDKVLSRRG